MTKQELRKIYLEKRLKLSAQEKEKLDNDMLKCLSHLSVGDYGCDYFLMSYFPIQEKNEPNTLLFSNYLKGIKREPHPLFCYPKCNFATNNIQAVFVDEKTVYQKNNYNITEPENGRICDPKYINVIFVPLITCDIKGFRVGYGKGFYDKFLKSCRTDVVKIGFSYFPPVEKILDIQEFDIPLNFCVTPDTIYVF